MSLFEKALYIGAMEDAGEARQETDALRAEIARLTDALEAGDSHCLCRADNMQLEAELAKYRGMEMELAALKNDNERLRKVPKILAERLRAWSRQPLLFGSNEFHAGHDYACSCMIHIIEQEGAE